ncbi:MAG: peptidoglycan-binding protein [Desulfobacteraceae bacterium]|nr:peptidoglycan-binding protein [Desulfobacteraceae bacterium]
MPDLPETRAELEALRAGLVPPYKDAKARSDQTGMARLRELAGQIDDALDLLALGEARGAAKKLEELRPRIEDATQQAKSWPFLSSGLPDDRERSYRAVLQDNDFDDEGPAVPAPEPVPVSAEKLPVVSPGWAENYRELWNTMIIKPEWEKPADRLAREIIGKQGRYASAVSGTRVPWWFVAVVHAMECGLKFSGHLHNGDSLSARTVRVPKGRPPVGSPPFTWEESARDSISYDRLDEVTDWSLTSALYHWHRYNGINNEYKRRGIPTPYLWSGSQHYRKGKYVADGVFDPEKSSGQLGAAVILKALINVGAVTIENETLGGNPDAATEHPPSLAIATSQPLSEHVVAELAYPGPLKLGSGKTHEERPGVKRLQEWLNLHGCATAIDSDFGESTLDRLKCFQEKRNRRATGVLDLETWVLLTTPLRRAVAPMDFGASSLEDAVIRVARQHINELPTEVGGNNRGPWVRLYMNGKDGPEQRWCAGFVCFIVSQAARDLTTAMPFRRQVSVDELVKDAKASGRFVPETEVNDPVKLRSKVRPGCIFAIRQSEADWNHTGFVLALKDKTFDTLEGNTGGEGGTDGPNAREVNRSYVKKDFLRLV